MLKKILVALLTVSGIFEIYQAVNAFLNPDWLLKLLNIPDSVGARTLNHITAWFLLLVSILILICLDWIRRDKREGLTLALILGAWWVGIGVGIYLMSGITTNLYADSLKGLLIGGLSAALLKKS